MLSTDHLLFNWLTVCINLSPLHQLTQPCQAFCGVHRLHLDQGIDGARRKGLFHDELGPGERVGKDESEAPAYDHGQMNCSCYASKDSRGHADFI